MTHTRKLYLATGLSALLFSVGCGGDSDNNTDTQPDAATTVDASVSEDASTPTETADLIEEGITGCQGAEGSAIALRLMAKFDWTNSGQTCLYADFGPDGEGKADLVSSPSDLKVLTFSTAKPPCAISAPASAIRSHLLGGVSGTLTVKDNVASMDIFYAVLGLRAVHLKSDSVDVSATCAIED